MRAASSAFRSSLGDRRRARGLRLCLLAGLCLLSNPGTTAAQTQAEDAERPPSLRSSCISLSEIQRSEVIDDETILFHLRNGRIKKATLAFGCPSLKFYDSFSYRVYSNRLCARVDVILSRGGAHCPIAEISDYAPAEKQPRSDNARD